MSRRLRFALAGWMVIAALTATACVGRQSGSGETPGKVSAQSPAVGGEYVYHVPADPDTFAPFWATSAYSSAVTSRVFGEGLLKINALTKTPEPALAEAMPSVSADSKTYTFKLRKGITFHDGTEVKAQDIVFAYEVLMHQDYKGSWKSTVAPLASVKAVDDYTIEMQTKEVFAPFLFGSASVYPLPRAKLEGVGVKDLASHDFWKNPIGAGPWRFVEWKPGQHTLLERFDGYYLNGKEGYELALEKGKVGLHGPWFDRMRIRVISETNTAIAALEAGELSAMGSVDPTEVDRLKQEQGSKLNAFDWDRMGYGFQTFNNDLFPTNIKEVRQALSHGLNRPAIISGVLDNKATLPKGFVPPIHWVHNASLKGYDYDPKKAAQLLEKAGFTKNAQGKLEKDGKPLKIQYVATKGNSIIEGVALQSQKDWEALGAEVELIMVDFNTLLDRHLKPGEYHVTFSGLGFSVDPHFSFDAFHSKNINLDDKGVAQGSNRARYTNPRVDKLIEQGMATLDLNARKKIYNEAEQIIVDDATSNWIYVNLWTDFAKKEIKGIVNANGYGMSYDTQWYVQEK